MGGPRELDDPHKRATFAKIVEHYVIPDDLESSDYGPHSGTTYEERVLVNYAWGMYKPKDAARSFADKWLKFCDECGSEGHVRFDCDASQ